MKVLTYSFLLLLMCSVAFGLGLDANTSLLAHCDGSDSGTTFSDSSTNNPKGNATVVANAITSTDAQKWGTASAKFDGTDDGIYWADDPGWDVTGSNADNWNVDCQVKLIDEDEDQFYVGQWEDFSNGWQILQFASGYQVKFQWRIEGGTELNIGGNGISDNDWHHILLIKKAQLYGVYVDGTQISYGTSASTDTYTGALYVGLEGTATDTNGYIDEVRVQHSNYFGGTPNDVPDDAIVVPTEAYSGAAVTVGQVIKFN